MQTNLQIDTPASKSSRPWIGLLLGVWALFLFVALVDFKPEQSWWHSTLPASSSADMQIPERPENLMGGMGVILAFWSLWFFGMAAYLAPMYLGWLSYLMFSGQALRVTKVRMWAIAVCLVAAAAWLNLFESRLLPAKTIDYDFFPGGLGGQIGVFFYHVFLLQFLGSFGSTVIMLLLFGGGTALIFTDELQKLWAMTRSHIDTLIASPATPLNTASADDAEGASAENASEEKPKRTRKKLAESVKELFAKGAAKAKKTEEPTQADILGRMNKRSKADSADSSSDVKVTGLKIIAGSTVAKASARALLKKKNGFVMPTLELLAPAVKVDRALSAEGHQETASTLVRILADFGVSVRPGEIHAGPVVTRYDMYPAPGVRVEKIVNLERNLQLGIKSQSVRILAPVPGKDCVGVELPNKNPEPVLLREILESADWARSGAEIPIALGKETSGKPLIADLTKMPHLLIAGSTGSGKTVCINSIIASLVYRFTPEDLRFVMVDPKIVEMQIYNDLPHMLIPVVTSPKKVPAALKYLIGEMEHRYQLFAKMGVKNLAGFNAKRAKDREAMEAAAKSESSPEERAAIAEVTQQSTAADDITEIPEKLPYIVAIIDELADLMMVAPAEVESSVVRLAQLARAAGIHLIIATQRPSVNVITGLIKANLPSRIAFKVASKVDGRTIMDQGGADMLIGRGDMLFTPPGAYQVIRAQGAFIADDEGSKIVEALKVNGAPKFDDAFIARLDQAEAEANAEEDGGSAGASGDIDEGDLARALEVLKSTQRASTSMLQRKLGWGYNRAARIMEELEARGVVAAGEGARPREILRDTL
jgi:DNA segregation ATPase FtsK/SpoIIIE, S-DNA-T family